MDESAYFIHSLFLYKSNSKLLLSGKTFASKIN